MLAGTLTEFSLQDIFQLLALTKKSGALVVSTDPAEGRVYFRDGQVYFAVADVRRLPLGARLVSAGHLSEERLRAVLDEHREAGAAGLAAAMLSSESLDEQTRTSFVRAQVHEATFGLMRLDDGRFTFDTSEQGGEWPVPPIATDQLVAEATHRMGEWEAIRQHLPSFDAVPAANPNPVGEQVSLTREQWHLLTLIDGRRSVRDLVELCGQGEFATAQLLAGLVAAGLVEVAEAGGRTALAELLAAREALRKLEETSLGAASANGSAVPSRPTAPSARPARSTLIEMPERRPEPKPEPEAAAEADAPEASAEVEGEAGARKDEADPAVETDVEPKAESSEEPADEESHEDSGEDDDDDQQAPPAARNGAASTSMVDRAQVARELASLGLGDDAPPRRPTQSSGTQRAATAPGVGPRASEDLTRDSEIDRGLLHRLIDGVKGA